MKHLFLKLFLTALIVLFSESSADPLKVIVYPEQHKHPACLAQLKNLMVESLHDSSIHLALESWVYDEKNGIYPPSVDNGSQRSPDEYSLVKILVKAGDNKNFFGVEGLDYLADMDVVGGALNYLFYYQSLKDLLERFGNDPSTTAYKQHIANILYAGASVFGFMRLSLSPEIKKLYEETDAYIKLNQYYEPFINKLPSDYSKYTIAAFTPHLATIKDAAQKTNALLTKKYPGQNAQFKTFIDAEVKRMIPLSPLYLKLSASDPSIFRMNAADTVFRNLAMIQNFIKIHKSRPEIQSISFVVGFAHIPGMKELIASGYAKENNQSQLTFDYKPVCN